MISCEQGRRLEVNKFVVRIFILDLFTASSQEFDLQNDSLGFMDNLFC